MLRGAFRVDHARHRYFVGGTSVPGIHAVLRAGGVEPAMPFLDEQYRQRGKAVHAWTLSHDLGAEPPPLAIDDWRPFCAAYVALRAAVPCRWRLLEHATVDRTLRFASRVDRVGTVNRWPALAELKTGQPAGWHGPQLAGADLLLGGTRGIRRRFGFYLLADGRYRVVEYSNPNDYLIFLTALERYWEGYGQAGTDRSHGLGGPAPGNGADTGHSTGGGPRP